MNIKVRELLKQVERMELAAKHGLDITRILFREYRPRKLSQPSSVNGC
jgi:hypothetical protein